ncbi:auxin-induced protein x15 [Phtheirospermum japonicum]|uniref:Auxin-induced protein x15 n=1 Tax=Phtheirospermum japonicum TaxID=374723 RepID=A0A830C523_9LAMI|nr:auxin-induced protein x15 [Phtheirospermum japonicum]
MGAEVPKGHFAVYVGGNEKKYFCNPTCILEPLNVSRIAISSRRRLWFSSSNGRPYNSLQWRVIC